MPWSLPPDTPGSYLEEAKDPWRREYRILLSVYRSASNRILVRAADVLAKIAARRIPPVVDHGTNNLTTRSAVGHASGSPSGFHFHPARPDRVARHGQFFKRIGLRRGGSQPSNTRINTRVAEILAFKGGNGWLWTKEYASRWISWLTQLFSLPEPTPSRINRSAASGLGLARQT